MNDLAFGSTLLSILVTLAAAVLVEATQSTIPARAPEPVIGNGGTSRQVQVAGTRASNCDCDTRLFARVGAR
jgi:hypothetical protein